MHSNDRADGAYAITQQQQLDVLGRLDAVLLQVALDQTTASGRRTLFGRLCAAHGADGVDAKRFGAERCGIAPPRTRRAFYGWMRAFVCLCGGALIATARPHKCIRFAHVSCVVYAVFYCWGDVWNMECGA